MDRRAMDAALRRIRESVDTGRVVLRGSDGSTRWLDEWRALDLALAAMSASTAADALASLPPGLADWLRDTALEGPGDVETLLVSLARPRPLATGGRVPAPAPTAPTARTEGPGERPGAPETPAQKAERFERERRAEIERRGRGPRTAMTDEEVMAEMEREARRAERGERRARRGGIH